jgi:hypothetical protein
VKVFAVISTLSVLAFHFFSSPSLDDDGVESEQAFLILMILLSFAARRGINHDTSPASALPCSRSQPPSILDIMHPFRPGEGIFNLVNAEFIRLQCNKLM